MTTACGCIRFAEELVNIKVLSAGQSLHRRNRGEWQQIAGCGPLRRPKTFSDFRIFGFSDFRNESIPNWTSFSRHREVLRTFVIDAP
jgi:hypothetical protein